MWAQLASTAVGLWLMAAPGILGYSGAAATNDRIFGPLVATFACIAVWEVTRALRWVNVVLGVWLAASAWFVAPDLAVLVNGVAAGTLLVCLSLARGRLRHRIGGGWRTLGPASGCQ